jgi:hypothetical protein
VPRFTITRGFIAFGLGSVAQGVPLVLVAVALERRGAGSEWLAAVAVARLAPYLVCSPGAGALAGRLDPRRVFSIVGLARGGVAAGLGVALAAEAPFGLLVGMMFALVAVGTPAYPALMRVVHGAVPASDLDRASAVAAGLESAAFWAGPALGGALLVAGPAVAVGVGVAMSLASVVVARSIASIDAAQPASRAVHSVSAAFGCLLGPAVRPALAAVIGVNVLAGLVTALLVRLPSELGSGGEREYGVLSFVQGCGALVAFAALVGPNVRVRRPLVPLMTAGAAVGALAAGGDLAVAVLACAAFGASVLAAEVVATSSISRSVPGPFVAPAFGLLDAWMVAAMIAGAVAAPPLVAAVGLRMSLVLVGVGTPLIAAVALRRRGRAVTGPATCPPVTRGALS